MLGRLASSIREALLAVAVATVVFYPALPAHGQLREDFESPDPSWKLTGADCGVRVLGHKRSIEQAHAGSTSEHLRFVAGQGTHVYYSFDLGRSPIVDETNCSLWIKSDRARLQLLARVVLPRTVDERSGKPITAVLVGDEYGEIGSWQQLQFKNLPKLLAQQTIVLRRQFGPHVDPREAYIDLVVLNTYGGPGETNVWIDDLEVQGVIDPSWARQTAPESKGGSSDGSPSSKPALRPAVVQGNVLLIENRPTLIRAIEHREESFEVLKAIGFNAVVLSTPPTSEQNDEARRFDLWLIGPPPDLAAEPAAAAKLDRVIAWHLGNQLGSEELAATRSLGSTLRAADRSLARPLVCGVRSDAWSYSREAQLLCWDSPPMFGPQTFGTFTAGLRARTTEARVGFPSWATVQLGPAPELMEQLSLLDPSTPTTLSADLDQARLATISALAAGVRGLVFRTGTKLDGDDEASQQRAAMLRLLNLELDMIEPWFAGGSPPQEITTGDPTLNATLLQTERSRLVLLVRQQPHAQFVTPPVANDTISLVLPGVPVADRFYHLTTDGLRQLETPPGSTGGRLVVPEAGSTAIVAVTQDPLVIQHLTRTSQTHRQEAVEMRLRLVANRLASTAVTAAEIRHALAPPREADAMLREAQRYLTEADRLLVRRDHTGCYRNTRRVETLVNQARRAWWDSVQATFPSPLSSPCCVSFETLPAHVRTAQRLQAGAWTKNGLPTGDCEHLDRMIASGWKQQQSNSPDVATVVDLNTTAPHGGARSLRLSAAARDRRDVSLDEPAVSITTAAVQARAGQIARLHGFVRIPRPLGGANRGLMIFDNFAGEALAEVVAHAPAWREFTLYRAVPRDGEVKLTLALNGLGEAYVDDLTIELVTPASQ